MTGECPKCDAIFSMRDDFEPPEHGLCWPCSSEEVSKLRAKVEGLKQELVKGLPSLTALRQIDVLQDENGRLEGRLKDVDRQLCDSHKLLDIARELLSEHGGSPGTVREIRDLLKRHKTSETRKPIFILCSGCGSQQKDCKCT